MNDEILHRLEKKVDGICNATNEIKVKVGQIETSFGYLKDNFEAHKQEECPNIKDHYNDEHKGFWTRIILILGAVVTAIIGIIEISKKISFN